jgi:hypothetical protein
VKRFRLAAQLHKEQSVLKGVISIFSSYICVGVYMKLLGTFLGDKQ